MTGNNEGQFDLETLTDEEVLKLTPEQIDNLSSGSEEEEEEEEIVTEEVTTENQPPVVEDLVEDEPVIENKSIEEEQEEEDGEPAVEEQPKTPETPTEPAKSTDKPFTEEKQGSEDETKSEQKLTEEAQKEAVKPEEAAKVAVAQDFYSKITAPFKADGKDFTVKTPEDAIRLMQQGVNYSRRMQELKPVRALNHMLTQHGLNDPTKLSYLIDIHNGKPEAIQKLLKDKGIDPLDINTADESTYQATDYRGNPKDMAFREAIENTVAAPGGREILTEINTDWDESSKELLRESPQIFNTLLEHKQSDVYEKTTKELNYQQTLGYLKDIPYIQAYHQVAEALHKAGAFGTEQERPTQLEPKTPIDTGPRKATLKTKSEKPNQDISSLNQPKAAPSSDALVADENDYSTMSDEEFLKLNVPG